MPPKLKGVQDSAISNLTAALNRDLNAPVRTTGKTLENLVGLPFPWLALRYLFQTTAYPLGRITQTTGEEGSAKTAFLYEIMRLHLEYGGIAAYIENEGKDAPVMRAAILRWNQDYLDRVMCLKAKSMNDWQCMITSLTKNAAEDQDRRGGPGRTYPVFIGLDSIMGTSTEESINKIEERGSAGRANPIEALSLSHFMRAVPEMLGDYPFSIMGTNHAKPGTDFAGRPTMNIPGGKSVKFMESYEIHMAKAPSPDIRQLTHDGLRITFKAKKASLGASRCSVNADLLWWRPRNEETNQRLPLQMAWDWHTATIGLLLELEKKDGEKTKAKAIQSLCDIRAKSASLAYSKTLGVSEENAVEYRVLGEMYENFLISNPGIREEVHAILGINDLYPFLPGVDFRDTQAKAALAVQQQTAEASKWQEEHGLEMPTADETSNV